MEDYDNLMPLIDQVDEVHRRGHPDYFCTFAGPVRTRERVEGWHVGPGSTVLVAKSAGSLIAAALLTTLPPLAGAAPRKVIQIDNVVVHADHRGQLVSQLLMETGVDGRACRTPCNPAETRRRLLCRAAFNMPVICTIAAGTNHADEQQAS
jgi:hypothetical protein